MTNDYYKNFNREPEPPGTGEAILDSVKLFLTTLVPYAFEVIAFYFGIKYLAILTVVGLGAITLPQVLVFLILTAMLGAHFRTGLRINPFDSWGKAALKKFEQKYSRYLDK